MKIQSDFYFLYFTELQETDGSDLATVFSRNKKNLHPAEQRIGQSCEG